MSQLRSHVSSRAFVEPPPMKRFRKKLEQAPDLFLDGDVIVVTDPQLARQVLSFQPDIFEETALLGSSTPWLRNARTDLRRFTNELAVTQNELAERSLFELNRTGAIRALVTAALDTFGPLVVGNYYQKIRSLAYGSR